MPDRRYLEKRKDRNVWHVVLDVPADVRDRIGTRKLRRSTGTASLKEAQTRRWSIISEWKQRIEHARRTDQGDLMAQAMLFRQDPPRDSEGVIIPPFDDLVERIQAIHGPETAATFTGTALGTKTPVAELVEPWLEHSSMTDQTRTLYRAAVKRFLQWAGEHTTIEGITRKMAGSYVADGLRPSGLKPKTINRDLSALGRLWKYAEQRGLVEGDNPWRGQAVPERQDKRGTDGQDQERPFTDSELRRLLDNAPDRTIRDLTIMGALTGMRLEEITQVKVGDVNEQVIQVREGKTAAAIRRVPVHSDLQPIISKRLKGKADDAFLFDEVDSRTAKRSAAISKRWNRYRKVMGLDERPNGQRRSLVNFHSLRRWFITTAERADVRESVLVALVGHERQGETFGRYSGGPSDEQLRTVVEAVSCRETSSLRTID